MILLCNKIQVDSTESSNLQDMQTNQSCFGFNFNFNCYLQVDSDEWDEEDAISPNDCFFCSHHSSNNDKNLLHMSEKHSFFVPDLEFVINVDGLLTYIGCKVSISIDLF